MAVRLYLWNVAVGQSFHFPLQIVEVTVRNAVNRAFTDRFGGDWWRDPICMDMLGARLAGDIVDTADRYRRRYRREPQADNVVANLTMGFWAATLKPRMNGVFWSRQLAHAFPHVGEFTLKDVSAAMTRVLDLRNRVFHHEPLFRRSLSEDYGLILKLLGWVCPQTRDWVRSHCSVPSVIRSRPR